MGGERRPTAGLLAGGLLLAPLSARPPAPGAGRRPAGARALREGLRRPPGWLAIPARERGASAPGPGLLRRVDETAAERRDRPPGAPPPHRSRRADPRDLQPRALRRAPGVPGHPGAAAGVPLADSEGGFTPLPKPPPRNRLRRQSRRANRSKFGECVGESGHSPTGTWLSRRMCAAATARRF